MDETTIRTVVLPGWQAVALAAVASVTILSACTCGGGNRNCFDECAQSITRCSGDSVESCGDFDDDRCLEFGNAIVCPGTESCSFGLCSDPLLCSDECVTGTAFCVGDATQTCGEYDSDACTDYGPPVACASGETCSNGACSAECSDECGQVSGECLDGATERLCGDYDTDTCSDWGPATPCPGGEVCVSASGGGTCDTVMCGQATQSTTMYSCTLEWSCPDTGDSYRIDCYAPKGGTEWGCYGSENCVDCSPTCQWTTPETEAAACDTYVSNCPFPAHSGIAAGI